MVGRVYRPANTTPQKSERVLSSYVLGDRDHSSYCVAILAVFGKNAMGLAPLVTSVEIINLLLPTKTLS
jgi:hypothetical protein